MRVKVLILMAGNFLFGCKTQDNSPTSVGSVDLARYSGLWYDIASYPARFQKDCHCTTAEYFITSENYITVINKCRKGGFDKPVRSVSGKAFVVEGSSNTKLKVQFFWPFRADYQIIKLDQEYKWAVVSSGKDYLWLLSRTPFMDKPLYDSIVNFLKKEGYETERLVRTPQPCN